MLTTDERLALRILSQEEITRKANLWRFKDEKIVFTNGCFDLLHQGHLYLLKKAADLGTRLIVGLNSDESISRLKGKNRPVINQQTRIQHLASLFYVDAVVVFEEDTPGKLIEAIRPDVLVKGGDYSDQEIVGAKFVRENGGEVVFIPFLDGFSTTTFLSHLSER